MGSIFYFLKGPKISQKNRKEAILLLYFTLLGHSMVFGKCSTVLGKCSMLIMEQSTKTVEQSIVIMDKSTDIMESAIPNFSWGRSTIISPRIHPGDTKQPAASGL